VTVVHTLHIEDGDAAATSEPGTVFFIGNATVLIRQAGFTILTDPSFIHRHEQTWLGYGLHTTRLTDPAMEIADLPPIDLVVLSHFHGDHFDRAAEEGLDHGTPIVTTAQAVKELQERGFEKTYGLDTWESFSLTKGAHQLLVTALPARHGPPIVDVALPDVMGSMLTFGPAPSGADVRMYISGDTLLIDELREIAERYRDVDLGLFHLGGTKVLGIMVSMDAEQGVQAVRLIAPQVAIPIHVDDYDVFTSPLSDFQMAVEEAGLSNKVRYLTRGESYTLAPR